MKPELAKLLCAYRGADVDGGHHEWFSLHRVFAGGTMMLELATMLPSTWEFLFRTECTPTCHMSQTTRHTTRHNTLHT